MKSENVTFECEIRQDNPDKNAIAVASEFLEPDPYREGEEREILVWLPRSLIEYEPVGRGQSIIVTMPEWLAVEKGLI